ncbi:MAG TPA: arylamine N-acetyltransferase [Rhodanobacteraceae bacterium]
MVTHLGFKVRPLSARVRVGVTDRGVDLPRTHLLLEVRIDDADWITDVGVGAASLTRALRLEADTEQVTPHDRRRLQHVAGKWYHQILRDGAWQDVYEFTGETMPLIDRTVGNWYTSTHPDSKFRKNLAVALARPDGGRVTLHNNTLAQYGTEGPVERTDVSAPEALRAALRAHFGINLRTGARIHWPATD